MFERFDHINPFQSLPFGNHDEQDVLDQLDEPRRSVVGDGVIDQILKEWEANDDR